MLSNHQSSKLSKLNNHSTSNVADIASMVVTLPMVVTTLECLSCSNNIWYPGKMLSKTMKLLQRSEIGSVWKKSTKSI